MRNMVHMHNHECDTQTGKATWGAQGNKEEERMLQTKSSNTRYLLDRMNVFEKCSGCVVYPHQENVAIFLRWRAVGAQI